MVFFGFETVFLTVCSLTREERRKRNVGGIVCGSLGDLFSRFRKEYGGTFFREDVNTGSDVFDVIEHYGC